MKFLKDRRLRYGGYAVIATVLVIAALVGVNVAAKSIEDNWALRLDLSYNSLTKFSDSTKNALAELDQPITYYVMAAPGSENAQLMEVLDRFRASNGNITVTTVDPDKNPGLVNKFRGSASSLSSNTVVVANADETRFKVYPYSTMINTAVNQNTGSYYISSYKFEQVLAQGLLYVTSPKTYTAYFMEGHGETAFASLSTLTTLLSDNNYNSEVLPLGADMPDPGSGVVMILNPQRDIDETTRESMMGYAQNGGGFVFVWDVSTPSDLPNFQAVLDFYNTGFEQGVVVANIDDPAQYYRHPQTGASSPVYLLANVGEHEVTEPLTQAGAADILAVTPLAIKPPEMVKNEVTITPLLTSGAGSFLADPTVQRSDFKRRDNEPLGPYNLAAAILRHNFADTSKDSRAVVIGSVSSIAAYDALHTFNNGAFVLSALKWAAKDEAVNLSVYSKTAQRGTLQITSMSEIYLLAGLSILLLPLLTLAAALIVTLRRRHL
ncbi:MAG: GldG family protein [Oscillospiraceae bacterium]|jgi:ABC-2 type transport system permease protein|nr:GldG family protein [Oscillospiraceae bacterium]